MNGEAVRRRARRLDFGLLVIISGALMSRLLLALAPLSLAACAGRGDDSTCPSAPALPGCNPQLSARGCEAEGGCWGTWGMSDRETCNCPTSDEGAPCTSNDDCEGACVAPLEGCETATAGTCSGLSQVYGCYCAPYGDGQWETICVD